MPYLQSNALPRDTVKALACAISDFGDLVCPHCTCQIITPPYAQVRPGWGRCPRCHGRFSVDERQAKCANLRAAAMMAGVAKRAAPATPSPQGSAVPFSLPEKGTADLHHTDDVGRG